MRDAREIIQELELDPDVKVRSYAAIWDGPLGFAFHVEPGAESEFAGRLRDLAAAVEATR